MVAAKIVIPLSEGKFVAYVPVSLVSKFLLDYSGLKIDDLVGTTIEFVTFSFD